MKNFTLQEELETWINEETGEGEYSQFSFWADTSTGDFDSEKGAMIDYEIYAFNNITGEKYVGKGGYYNNNGHSFNYPVEFILQIKKEKKAKKKYTPVKLLQDESSHWYVVPNDEADEFKKLHNWICDNEDTDGVEDVILEFENKFSKYRTGGSPNNHQLYMYGYPIN